jgi:RHS repeat-associated protein
MVADIDGDPISEVRYSAFGEVRYDSGTMTTDYLYTGQREEAEVGLYYYVARWYDPAMGRFIQADSVVPNPMSAVGFDRYAYVGNNPLKYIDPSGHSKIYALPDDDIPIPVPDAPPDFSNDLDRADPPNIPGLPAEDWEWSWNWESYGPGWKNKSDPNNIVWRPDENKPSRNATEGEQPHWHGSGPGGISIDFPANYQWGRGKNQRSYPGEFDGVGYSFDLDPNYDDGLLINVPDPFQIPQESFPIGENENGGMIVDVPPVTDLPQESFPLHPQEAQIITMVGVVSVSTLVLLLAGGGGGGINWILAQ